MERIAPYLLCLICFTSYAGISGLNQDHFSGPYLSLGADMLIRSDQMQSIAKSDGFTFFKASNTGSTVGPAAAFGVRHKFRRFTINGDIALRYFPGTSRGVVVSGINTLRVSSKVNLGLELSPGFVLNSRTVLFALMGFEVAHYKVGHQFNSVDTHFSGWQMGPAIGAGADFSISPHIIMQLKYMYIHYNTLHYDDVGNSANVEFLPRMNIVGLTLAYRFK